MQSSTSISQLFLTTILPVVTSISRNFQTCENHLDCRFGGTCETSKFIKNVKGICKCKHNCYKYAEKAICTMDGNIFYSHCELQRQECLERRKITIMCDGHDCENYSQFKSSVRVEIRQFLGIFITIFGKKLRRSTGKWRGEFFRRQKKRN